MGVRQRTAARRWIAHHLVNHARARREMPLQRLAGVSVHAHDLAIIGGADPQRFPVEGDAARTVRFRFKRPQDLALVIDQMGFVAGALIDDPQAVGGRLQSVRLRIGAGSLENNFDFPDFSFGKLLEIQRERAGQRDRRRPGEKGSALHCGSSFGLRKYSTLAAGWRRAAPICRRRWSSCRNISQPPRGPWP